MSDTRKVPHDIQHAEADKARSLRHGLLKEGKERLLGKGDTLTHCPILKHSHKKEYNKKRGSQTNRELCVREENRGKATRRQQPDGGSPTITVNGREKLLSVKEKNIGLFEYFVKLKRRVIIIIFFFFGFWVKIFHPNLHPTAHHS